MLDGGLVSWMTGPLADRTWRFGLHTRRGQWPAASMKSLSVVNRVSSWRMQSCARTASCDARRRDGETLFQLMTHLDAAIAKAADEDLCIDEINNGPSNAL